MNRRNMYIPAWQGLNIGDFVRPLHQDAVPFPFDAPHKTYFHTTRSAIYHLFRKLVQAGRKTVLAPDYHMGNELRAIRAAGAQVVLYPIGRDMQPDLDSVRRLCGRGADTLFTIHYAGWPQPLRELRRLCDEHGMTLVEDCALALLSESDGRAVGTFGDYALFCLYKSLPVLDGGMLVQNRNVFPELDALALEPIGTAFEAGRLAELWIDQFRSRFPYAGAMLASLKRHIGAILTACHVTRVPVGDIGFQPAQSSLAMSRWSARMVPRLDFLGIRRRRRENYQLLSQVLETAGLPGFVTLGPGVCPLFFPFLVRDKSAAARALGAYGIMATELWNEGDPNSATAEGGGARFLRRHVLELPIHQDVNEAQIRYMARHVTRLKLALEPRLDGASPMSMVAGQQADLVSGTCVGSS